MRTLPVALSLLFFSCPVALAGNPRVDRAVKKGTTFIKSKQDRRDGLFKDKWFHAYPAGGTALSLLTLLKTGEDAKSPVIRAGFKAMFKAPLKKIYSVSIGVLAVEARYSPTAIQLNGSLDPFKTVARKKFRKKAAPFDKKWLIRAAQFLIKTQKKNGLWNYPHGGDDDLSNTQFAILALKSAKRLGVKVPDEVWAKTMTYLLAQQQQSGGKVDHFPVPAADGAISKASRGSWSETLERVTMVARGWGYKPGQGPRGSMTAAAVACLVVIKSELENKKAFKRRFARRVDKSLRDGCAWLGQNFKADQHPGAELDWLFYYLYTLERAGTLTACDKFANHDWYSAGREVILASQGGDGSFLHNTPGEVDGKLAGTCLAVLFLKRSTVPVLERVATGSVQKLKEPTGLARKKLQDGRFQVTFRLKAARAGSKVSVAGSFNNWSKDQTLLADNDGDGIFEVTVTLSAGSHQYKFVIDGHQWLTDPKNSKRQGDGHGGENSLLELH